MRVKIQWIRRLLTSKHGKTPYSAIGGKGMQLNITTDYAIRALIYISSREGIMTLTEISDGCKAPRDYVGNILRKLRDADMIYAKAGVKGGYSKKKELKDITIWDVMQITEDSNLVNKCLAGEHMCSLMGEHKNLCKLHCYYIGIQKELEQLFRNKSIQEIIDSTECSL